MNARHALRILAADLRRMAAKCRGRGDDADVGVRVEGGDTRRADRVRPDAGGGTQPERHQGAGRAVAGRVVHGGGAGGGDAHAGDHGRRAARRFTVPRCWRSRRRTSTTSPGGGCRSMSCRRGGRTRRRSTASPSRSTTTATRARRSGCMSSIASGQRDHVTFEGRYYRVEDTILQPKPVSPAAPAPLRGRRVPCGARDDRPPVRRLRHARRLAGTHRGAYRRYARPPGADGAATAHVRRRRL